MAATNVPEASAWVIAALMAAGRSSATIKRHEVELGAFAGFLEARGRRRAATARLSKAPRPPRRCAAPIVEFGSPISYEVLTEGAAVHSADGAQVGVVSHVLAAADQDIFDGLVITQLTDELFPKRSEHRFIDAPDIDRIYEHGVTLKLTAAACRELPEPSANPAVMHDDPSDSASATGSKLRRAWDLMSGNY